MKQVSNIKESEPEKTEYYFDIALEDGHVSKIKVIKEMGEYVLVGDDRQHFCSSELSIILHTINNLNSQIYQPSMMSDYDCDPDDNEENEDD